MAGSRLVSQNMFAFPRLIAHVVSTFRIAGIQDAPMQTQPVSQETFQPGCLSLEAIIKPLHFAQTIES